MPHDFGYFESPHARVFLAGPEELVGLLDELAAGIVVLVDDRGVQAEPSGGHARANTRGAAAYY